MPQTNREMSDVEVFRNFLEDVKKHAKLARVITGFDAESLTAGGLLFKVLRSMELDVEVLPDYITPGIEVGVKSLGLNIPHTECDECLVFQTSNVNQVALVKHNYVVRYDSLIPGIIGLLSEFTSINKEMKAVAASAIHSKYLPRIRELRPNEREREFIDKLCSEGLLEVTDVPTLPHSTTPIHASVAGIDFYVPLSTVRESLSETLSIIANTYRVQQEKLRLKTYLIRFSWFVRDLTTLAYFIIWLLDVKGFEGYLPSIVNMSYLRSHYLEFVGGIKDMKACLDPVISEGVGALKTNKYLAVKGDPAKLSATVMGKVLWGFNVIDPLKTPVVLEHGGRHYVPLAHFTQNVRRRLTGRYVVQGGYLVTPNASDVL